jgi:hypothetical protein
MGWYDDGSEEQFQMEQRSRQAAQAEEAARLAKCEGCKRKLPINELGEHYEHSGSRAARIGRRSLLQP